jgi:hypothetical protein
MDHPIPGHPYLVAYQCLSSTRYAYSGVELVLRRVGMSRSHPESPLCI